MKINSHGNLKKSGGHYYTVAFCYQKLGMKVLQPYSPTTFKDREVMGSEKERLLNGKTKICPIRDYLSVELMSAPRELRAFRYDIYRDIYSSQNHIAYQPVGRHCLRHAGLRTLSFFYYPYFVPTGQQPSVKSLNSCKSAIQTC